MIVRFRTTDGETVLTQELTEEMLAETPNAEDAIESMLNMFKEFKRLDNIRVEGRYYNPANIVWIDLIHHEWLKERYPNLPWWDEQD